MNTRFLKSLDNPVSWWFCFGAGFAILAARLSTDGSWDLENYHIYNGFAVFHDRRGLDIAPAQLQTTLYYGLDTAYYLIFSTFNNRRVVINLLLSIPYSMAAVAIFFISRLFAKPRFLWPILVSAAAAVFGLSGAATFATLATTLSEVLPESRGSDCLRGMAHSRARATQYSLDGAWHRRPRRSLRRPQAHSRRRSSSACVRGDRGPSRDRQRSALLEALAFCACRPPCFRPSRRRLAVGQFQAYGNPIFPYHEQCLQSDLVAPGAWTDDGSCRKRPPMALLYPAHWALIPQSLSANCRCATRGSSLAA